MKKLKLKSFIKIAVAIIHVHLILWCIFGIVLFQSLASSASGQTITISNNAICFDSVAAKIAYDDVKIMKSVITNQDTIISDLTRQKDYLLNDCSESRIANSNLVFENTKLKKDNKFWKSFTFGVIVVEALVIIVCKK